MSMKHIRSPTDKTYIQLNNVKYKRQKRGKEYYV